MRRLKRNRRATAALAAAAALALGPKPAWGGNALNSNEKPDPKTKAEQPPAPKDEFTIVPVAGGSTDIGVGAGFFSALTRNLRGVDPYVWNIEAAAFASFVVDGGRLDSPYVDGYAKWTVTRLLDLPLQLEVRPSFTDEGILNYYGMGDASSAGPPAGRSQSFFHYGRIHPSILADLVFKLRDHVAGRTGLRYTATWLDVPADSKLAADARSGAPEVRKLVGSLGAQSVVLFRYGLRLDTRDNEVTTHSGTFDEIGFQWSPGGTAAFPFRYGQATVQLRGYLPLFARRVTLAARIVGDVLFGDPPFYELSRFEDTYAVGGSNGVRGVPAQRYYGKIKIFGSIEGRARVVDFEAFGKPMALGVAAFFDYGRVWADTEPHPELDGTSFGLKFGIGAGVRLMSGSAFVLRADAAWSPDAMPLGGYVAAGEMF